MSGRRRDPLAVLIRAGLSLASVPYGWVVTIRNRRYDRGIAEVHFCGVPVISVGNLTTGGTGKTPIVCLLAKWFRERGIRVAIVSRGYGRGSEACNDEAMELHARLPDVPHVQDSDRVKAANTAIEEFDAQILLMDDGFQHRRLHRDLNIVVVDALCPFGHGHLLPRGLLREPMGSLARADLVIITKCSSVDEATLTEIERRIHVQVDRLPIVRSDHRPAGLLEYPDRQLPIERLQGKKVAVLSAIGNPQAFESTVRQCGATIVDNRQLPDHDPFDPSTVARLGEWVRSLDDQISLLLCTHKDLVKLKTNQLGDRPIAAVVIELALTSDSACLESSLAETMAMIAQDQRR